MTRWDTIPDPAGITITIPQWSQRQAHTKSMWRCLSTGQSVLAALPASACLAVRAGHIAESWITSGYLLWPFKCAVIFQSQAPSREERILVGYFVSCAVCPALMNHIVKLGSGGLVRLRPRDIYHSGQFHIPLLWCYMHWPCPSTTLQADRTCWRMCLF